MKRKLAVILLGLGVLLSQYSYALSFGGWQIIRAEPEGTVDYMIVRFGTMISVDGYFIKEIDHETFEVIEWDYDKRYLHYSDKNGEFIAEFDREQDKYIIEEKR